MSKEEILKYFQNFLSDHKIELFEHVVMDRTRHFTFLLEDLFHPHNASAILRSSDCFGLQDVHMIENNHSFVNERDISMGSAKWLSIIRHNDQDESTPCSFDALKAKGYSITVLSPHHDDVTPETYPIEEKTAFVLGAEKTGLTELALSKADHYLRIPMYGFTESFNVSVTAAMVMQNMVERLRKTDIDWHLTADEQWEVKLAWTLRSIRSSQKIIKHFLELHPETSSLFDFSKFFQ